MRNTAVHNGAGAVQSVDRALAILEHLAERTRETVNLAVLDGEGVLNVDQVAGTRAAVSVSWLGRRTPVHSTSNGKILLAFAPEVERERLLATRLERTTARTIVERAELRAELDEVRARGWAKTVEELEEGLNAVAAPVFGNGADVVAAVSVAGPAFRLRPGALPRTARLAVEAADEISRRMGYISNDRKEAVRR